MSSRSLVLAALNHQETAKVPLDLAGHLSSGIAAIAYAKLRDELGLPKRPIRVCDMMQQLAIVDEDVLDRFGVDTVELGRGFNLHDVDWADWVLPDGTPCQVPAWLLPRRVDGSGWVIRGRSGRVLWRMAEHSLYFEQAHYPFAENPPDEEGLPTAMAEAELGVPSPYDLAPDRDRLLADGARLLRTRTDRAVVGLFGGSLFEGGQSYYRNDNFLMLLAAEPRQAHAFLDRLAETHLRQSRALPQRWSGHNRHRSVRRRPGHADRSADLPSHVSRILQATPRSYVAASQGAGQCQGAASLLRRRATAAARPDRRRAGRDQSRADQLHKAWRLRASRRDFGKDITFWGGGCDTRWMLAHGTPAEIREHVRRQVDVLRPGGGFVFQQVHNILADVPPRNIVAMLDAVNAGS